MKEKLAALVVKIQEHKKIAIIVGIVILAVIVLAIVIALSLSFRQKQSYKETINQLAKAVEDDKIEKYIDKYVDERAAYAYGECDGDLEDFKKEYKKAKKSDYKDNEYVESMLKGIENVEIEIKDIGKLEKVDDCKDIKKAKVKMQIKYLGMKQTANPKFYFYKGKLIAIEMN